MRGGPLVYPQGTLLTQLSPEFNTPLHPQLSHSLTSSNRMFSKITVAFAFAAMVAANPVPQVIPTSLPVSIPALPTSISLSLPVAVPTAVGGLAR